MITLFENFLRWLTTPAETKKRNAARAQFIRAHAHELGEKYAAEFWDKYN